LVFGHLAPLTPDAYHLLHTFAEEPAMKSFLSVFATAVLLASFCAAQDSGDSGSVVAAAKASTAQSKAEAVRKDDIRRLLDLTSASSIATDAMDNMEKDVRPLVTNALPAGEYREKLVDLFFEKFHAKRDPNQLVDLIVPIYEKYYTDDEVKGLIQLYQTPLGKKMLAVLPKIMSESQAAGAQWGQQLGRQCMLEVLAEHPELEQALEMAKKNPPTQP
jgi:uncharacterized protein